MKPDILQRAVDLAAKGANIFIATSSKSGVPHLAAAGGLDDAGPGRLAVTAWFCPGTLENVQRNKRLALVVWDSQADEGYQLIGQAEEVIDQAVLDGYTSPPAVSEPLPQVERRLVISVDEAMSFTHAPHSDLAL